MKTININDFIIKGHHSSGVHVGNTKAEIEKALGRTIGHADIETPDVNYYLVNVDDGVLLRLSFDKSDVCFEINFSFEDNTTNTFIIDLEGRSYELHEGMSFDRLIGLLSKMRIEWMFDVKRVFLQTVCIQLENGLRLYYAFGDKRDHDYGLFSIKSIL